MRLTLPWKSALLLVALLPGQPRPCGAQAPGMASDLLTRARAAYDGLRYPQADSLAQAVLRIPDLSRRQRLLALELRAASLYPEEDGAARQPAEVGRILSEVVRLTFPDQGLPQELTWPGLDSLYRVARGSTFAAAATHDHEYTLVGAEGDAAIPVRSTRSALFHLSYAGAAGTRVLDSVGPAVEGELHIRLLPATSSVLPNGPGELQLVATDMLTEERIVLRYPVTISAPTLEVVSPPPALQPSDFKPERRKPSAVKGVVMGLLSGSAMIVLGSVARGPKDFKDAVGADGRTIGLGIGVGIVTIAAGFLDPGTPLPENVRANSELQARYDQAVESARIQNERLRAGYRVKITFESEAP